MGMSEYSAHQQKIIKRYYKNMDAIQLQRFSELVTELYLSEGRKREKVWERITQAMQKLDIPQEQIDHLRQQDNPEVLAKIVSDLQGKK